MELKERKDFVANLELYAQKTKAFFDVVKLTKIAYIRRGEEIIKKGKMRDKSNPDHMSDSKKLYTLFDNIENINESYNEQLLKIKQLLERKTHAKAETRKQKNRNKRRQR